MCAIFLSHSFKPRLYLVLARMYHKQKHLLILFVHLLSMRAVFKMQYSLTIHGNFSHATNLAFSFWFLYFCLLKSSSLFFILTFCPAILSCILPSNPFYTRWVNYVQNNFSTNLFFVSLLLYNFFLSMFEKFF